MIHATADGETGWEITMESFRMHGQVVHGWGILHGPGDMPPIAEIHVRDCGDKPSCRLPLILGDFVRQSDDRVGRAFVIYGPLPTSATKNHSFALHLEWPGVSSVDLVLPAPRRLSGASLIYRLAGLPWSHYWSRGLKLIRQGDWRLLGSKLARMTKAALVSGMPVRRLLGWASAEGKPLTLVVDHDLGGGANQFRIRLVEELIAQGMTPFTLIMHHGVLAYQLSCRRGNRLRHSNLREISALFDALSTHDIRSVFFNNILSYPDPLGMIVALSDWMGSLPHKPEFLFFVHDYYSVCPSFLLLDRAGRYCGLPEPAVCARCLPSNPSRFIRFALGVDIATWRRIWLGLLDQADEIRCFSESSRRLMLKAHPGLEEKNVTVVPHSLSHLGLRRIRFSDPGWPVVGIVGHISHHKGSAVVRELAEHIRASESRVRLVIVGTIDEALPASVANVTGPYAARELPDIIERHGINLALFPSICPETFSFVVAELVEMGMPVLCFNLGAPAERVDRYEKGLVIDSTQPDCVLRGLDKLYLRHVKQFSVGA